MRRTFKKWWGYDWESKQPSAGSSGNDEQREVGGRGAGLDGPTPREFTFIDESTNEPRVFFHGTRDAFTTFDAKSAGKKEAPVKTRASAEAAPGLIPLHRDSNSKQIVVTSELWSAGAVPGFLLSTRLPERSAYPHHCGWTRSKQTSE